MIEVKNLSKKFGRINVLENLNCTIKTGSIYGLIGANGAGKSTLLRIINDVYRGDLGNVFIDGENVKDNQILKQRMAFVSDDFYSFPNYTLREYALFFKEMYKNFDIEFVDKTAKTLNLDINSKIQTFSKGMKRQCAIICALATNADYLFFDETFDGLDPVVRNFIKKLISDQMSKKETTVVMTSHNLRELEDICDNLGLLYKGGILFESDINTIKTNMFKVQISFKDECSKEKFDFLNILSYKKIGSVVTLIIKSDKEDAEQKLRALNPIILDFLPLTLEEVFIYEMEALGYEFNKLI